MVLFVLPGYESLVSSADEGEAAGIYGFALRQMNGGMLPFTELDKWVYFSSQNPTQMALPRDANMEITAAEYAQGTLYAFDSEGSFYTVSTSNFYPTMRGSCTDFLVSDMAYDWDSNHMYALAFEYATGDYVIATVNLTNGTMRTVLSLEPENIGGARIIAGLTYIGDGKFFAIDYTTLCPLIFGLDMDITSLTPFTDLDGRQASSLAYSAQTDKVYACVGVTVTESEEHLYEIDPRTGESRDLLRLGAGYGCLMSCIFTMDDVQPPEIPQAQSQEAFDAALNAQGGSLRFTNSIVKPFKVITEGTRTCVRSDIGGLDNSFCAIYSQMSGLEQGQVLSFDYKVSTEESYDYFSFNVNGEQKLRTSGAVGWATYNYTIPNDGDYLFTWDYSKDEAMANGSDSIYVDNVSLLGEAPQSVDQQTLFNRALNVEGGELSFTNHELLPFIIDSSTDTDRLCVRSATGNLPNAITYFTTTVHDAHAGDAIRFDWRADCEEFYDRLVFKSYSTIMLTTTGSTNWETETFVIPQDGSYVFTWAYLKSTEPEAGFNAGWVDNVEYIEDYNQPPIEHDPDFDAALNVDGASLTFTNDPDNPFQIVETEGRTVAKSTIEGMDNTYTTIHLDAGYLGVGSTLTFDWKTSCEQYADRASLYVNGAAIMVKSGNTGFETCVYTVEVAGEYEFGFGFEKNVGTNSYSDCCYYDNIALKRASTDTHTVTFFDFYGEVLEVQQVSDGESAQDVQPPLVENYIFKQWDSDISCIHQDMDVHPLYYRMGDANTDGSFNSGDAAAILKYCIALMQLDEFELILADINCDSNVNTGDASSVLEMIIAF